MDRGTELDEAKIDHLRGIKRAGDRSDLFLFHMFCFCSINAAQFPGGQTSPILCMQRIDLFDVQPRTSQFNTGHGPVTNPNQSIRNEIKGGGGKFHFPAQKTIFSWKLPVFSSLQKQAKTIFKKMRFGEGSFGVLDRKRGKTEGSTRIAQIDTNFSEI